jgi:regulator of sirC expression with transglutaminase-like and TPR domain
VLERKLGIPISLSCVALLVAQRLDLPVCGIGAPGHFLCFYGEPSIPSGTFFDPFNGFRNYSRAQVEEMVRALGNKPEPTMFAPVNEREIVARSLRNLIAYHRTHNELEQATRLLSWLDVLITHGANP